MVLEKLERVEAQFRLGDLQGFLEDVGGFVLYEEEVTMSLVLADLLHHTQEVDGGEEVAPRELGDGLVWVGGFGGWVAEFVEFRSVSFAGVLAFLEGECWELVFGAGDG